MRIQFHGLSNYICAFGTSSGKETHFIHRIQQLPVGGLEAVNLRNGPGHDLVLSGETTLQTALDVAADQKACEAAGTTPEFYAPDFIVRDIAELGDLLIQSRE